jgi:drug/metabolite transporter (DMT)-like permease
MALPSTDSHPQRAKADLVLLAAALGWGLTFPVAKDALAHVSPGAYLATRFLLGTGVAALLARRSLAHLPSLKYGALLGLVLWVGFALNTWGLRYTTATRSGFVTSLCVVLVPILGALAFSQRVGPSAYAGALLAAAGLFAMSARSLFQSDASLLGDALTVASAVAYAFHILLTGRFAPKVVPSAAVVGQAAVVAALSLAMLPFEDVRLEPTPSVVATLLFTGVFASALFIAMQLWAQARTTAVRAALIFTLEPLFSALFARVLLAEPMAVETWLGGALIILGILLAELAPRLRRPRPRLEVEPAE